MINSWVNEYKKYYYNLFNRTGLQPKEYLTKKLFVRIAIFISSVIILKIFNTPKYFLVSLIIFILEWIPFVHSSVYIIPTILYFLIEMQPNLAGAVSLLYLFIVSIDQISMPYILDTKLTVRPVVNVIIFLMFYLLFSIRGIFIASIILALFRAYVEWIDMKHENRKAQRIKKRRKIKH